MRKTDTNEPLKYRVIKVAVKFKASIVLSMREVALLYTSEKSRILNIQDTQSCYRASDTYKILSNYLNLAKLYISVLPVCLKHTVET